MDILKQAAFAYRKLLDKEYVITVGKNNVKRSYIVQFTTNEFKHICGLHKLKDINDVYRSSSNALFHKILHGEITVGDIQKAEAFSKIEARLKNAAYLEEYFDKFTVIYDWNQEKSKFSNIDADLMIPIHSAMLSNLETYIFLKNSGRKETLSLSDYIVENPEFNRVETSIVDKKIIGKDKFDRLHCCIKKKLFYLINHLKFCSTDFLFRPRRSYLQMGRIEQAVKRTLSMSSLIRLQKAWHDPKRKSMAICLPRKKRQNAPRYLQL